MTLSKIEAYLFKGNRVHFVRNFEFANGRIALTIIPIESVDRDATTATFADAVITSIWNDPSESTEWPLDIIGFDCHQSANRWNFVLNCDTVEWSWESEWPEVSETQLTNNEEATDT